MCAQFRRLKERFAQDTSPNAFKQPYPSSQSRRSRLHEKPPIIRMRFLFLFLLAMSAGAHPQFQSIDITSSNPSTPYTLTKRSNYAWVGSFKDQDCQGTHVGEGDYRPKLVYSNCHAFKLQEGVDYINIFWGTGDDRFSQLHFFSDAHCKTTPVYSKENPDKGDWSCFPKDLFNETVVAVAAILPQSN